MDDWDEPRRAEFRRRLALAVADAGRAVAVSKLTGIPKSNIYNWINGSVQDPPMRDIATIAAATGRDLDWLLAVDLVPISRNFGLAESDVTPYQEPGKTAVANRAGILGRWIVRSRALDLAGILPGDLIEFEIGGTPSQGEPVVAQVYDDAGDATTVLRLFYPPYLVIRSSDPAVEQRPIEIDETGEKNRIMGAFVQLVRRRA